MTPYQKRTLSPLAQRMAGDMWSATSRSGPSTPTPTTSNASPLLRQVPRSTRPRRYPHLPTAPDRGAESLLERLQSGRLWPTLPLSRHPSQTLGRAAGPLRQTAQAAALGVGLRRSQSVAGMCSSRSLGLHVGVDAVGQFVWPLSSGFLVRDLMQCTPVYVQVGSATQAIGRDLRRGAQPFRLIVVARLVFRSLPQETRQLSLAVVPRGLGQPSPHARLDELQGRFSVD